MNKISTVFLIILLTLQKIIYLEVLTIWYHKYHLSISDLLYLYDVNIFYMPRSLLYDTLKLLEIIPIKLLYYFMNFISKASPIQLIKIYVVLETIIKLNILLIKRLATDFS